MASFSGLYYPGESWDLEVEDSMLKKCLLFFDKIYAIVPEVFSVDWRTVQPYEELEPFLMAVRRAKEDERLRVKEAIETGQPSSGQEETYLPEIERHGRIERFLDKVGMLRKEGVLELVDPRENLTEPSYWKAESGPYPWLKIERHYQSILQQGLSLDELEVHKPPILYGGILSDLKDQDFRSVAANLGDKRVVLYKGQAEVNWLSFLGKSSGFPEDEWQALPTIGVFCGSWVGTVSTAMWAAFVVNHTLLTAHKHNLIPVTPSDIFRELLQSKVRRLRNFVGAAQLKESFLNHPEYETGFSGFSLAAFTLPNLEVMSFEDVLELRLALEEELTGFREQMTLLAERIRAEPWEPNFVTEIERITKQDIQPAVQKLQRKLESSQSEVVLRALKKVVSAPTALSMLATIWVGFPPLLVMAVAAGLVSIETALEHYFDHKKILQSNGFSLLLRIQ
jgi:hypothetical protein